MYAVAAADTSGPQGGTGVTVFDLTTGPGFPSGGDTQRYGLIAGDGVHPTDKGHVLIADELASFLAP
jgi:lysophospholipase L1-like esterase